MNFTLNPEEIIDLKHMGTLSLVGGSTSFLFCIAVLYFLRIKDATHFCNSRILYTYIIVHCAQSIVYMIQGSMLLVYFCTKIPYKKEYEICNFG